METRAHSGRPDRFHSLNVCLLCAFNQFLAKSFSWYRGGVSVKIHFSLLFRFWLFALHNTAEEHQARQRLVRGSEIKIFGSWRSNHVVRFVVKNGLAFLRLKRSLTCNRRSWRALTLFSLSASHFWTCSVNKRLECDYAISQICFCTLPCYMCCFLYKLGGTGNLASRLCIFRLSQRFYFSTFDCFM